MRRQTALVFGGNLFNALLAFAFSVTVIRFLGPAAYGLLAIALSLAALLAEIADFGLSTTVIRLVPKYLAAAPARAAAVLKISFYGRLAVSLAITAAGWFSAPFLALNFFHQLELILLFKLIFLGTFGILFSQFIITILQTKRRFGLMVFVQTLPNFFKLVGVLLLLFFNFLSSANILLVFISSFYLGFLIGCFFIPKQFIRTFASRESIGEVFNFSKWIFVSLVFGALFRRLDIFLLGRLTEPASVGIYAAAYQLTLLFSLFASSLQTIFFPTAATISEKSELKNFSVRLAKIFFLLFLFSTPFVFAAKWLIIPLFGAQFAGAGSLFVVLFFHAVLLAFRSLTSVLLCVLDQPQMVGLTDFLKLILALFILPLLISRFGPLGAGLGMIFVSLVGLTIEAAWVRSKFTKPLTPT